MDKRASDTPVVPYAALAELTSVVKSELMGVFEDVLDSGQYIMGQELEAFEREFAAYCGSSYAVGIANGTCALHLVLRGLGLSHRDEVITAPNSFIASASSIALTGATPVFVDIQPDLNMDPDLIEAAITPRTKAIIVVHLYGNLCDMDRLLAIGQKHNIPII